MKLQDVLLKANEDYRRRFGRGLTKGEASHDPSGFLALDTHGQAKYYQLM